MTGGAGVLVVGGGPAGVAAALAARAAGARVVLAERAFAGGNAVAHSLLPSKVHLAAAADLAAPAAWGLGGPPQGVAWAVATHLRWRREAARTACEEALRAAGVEWAAGPLAFHAPGRARLGAPAGARDLAFDAAVVAVGSVQDVPEGLVPDGRTVLLPRDLASMAEVPARATVLGAGATGVEIACLLKGYGAAVTLVGRAPRLLPGEDPVLADALREHLEAAGIAVRLGEAAVAYEAAPDGVRVDLAGGASLDAAVVFVATGRRSAAAGLGLESVGLAPGADGYLAVDRHGATASPGLYAAGDVTGPPLVANKAEAEGAVAGRSAALRSRGARPDGAGLDVRLVPVAVFSRPEYARVGTAPGAAALSGCETLDLADAAGLRRHVYALARPERTRLVVDRASGVVRGAAILGAAAAERILLYAAAVAWEVRADRLADLWPVVPAAGAEVRALARPPWAAADRIPSRRS